MASFYRLIDGTFSSKIVTSISVMYCHDQGQVYPVSRPQKNILRKMQVKRPSFSMSTMKVPACTRTLVVNVESNGSDSNPVSTCRSFVTLSKAFNPSLLASFLPPTKMEMCIKN